MTRQKPVPAKFTSRQVESTQLDCHDRLASVVKKHLATRFDKPFAPHNLASYTNAMTKINRPKIIFDSGCGNGISTVRLAQQHPDAFVLGIDKSAARLNKNQSIENSSSDNNFCLVRADLIDFLRLANNDDIKLYKHFFYYPNPWPKKNQLQRRWQGSPIFKDIVALGGAIEVRSNWKIYTEEFSQALQLAGIASTVAELTPIEDSYVSDFEAKYHRSGHSLWQMRSK